MQEVPGEEPNLEQIVTRVQFSPSFGDGFIGPPCPEHCPEGPESHPWQFSYDAMGGDTLTTECPICDRAVQQGLTDWPLEYLTLEPISVTLESFTEVYGYESPEYDHYVVMTPTKEEE